LTPGLRQGKYKMNLKYLVIPESKEVLKKEKRWGDMSMCLNGDVPKNM
jgi:hypothetical protein